MIVTGSQICSIMKAANLSWCEHKTKGEIWIQSIHPIAAQCKIGLVDHSHDAKYQIISDSRDPHTLIKSGDHSSMLMLLLSEIHNMK